MTASTPRSLSNAPPVLTMNFSDLSGSFFFDNDQQKEGGRASLAPRHNRRSLTSSTATMPPCLPSPTASRATARRPVCSIDAFPALPVLEPRAKTGAARAAAPSLPKTTGQQEQQPCLMDFVSHMSSLSCDTNDPEMLQERIFSFSHDTDIRRPSISEVAESAMELAQDVLDQMETAPSAASTSNCQKGHRVRAPSFHQLQPQITAPSDWTWETPETTKTMLTATPQAVPMMRGHQTPLQQKRKSPVLSIVVHETPVGGNRPLMLPSLNSSNNTTAHRCRSNQLQRGRPAVAHSNSNNMPTPRQQQNTSHSHQQRQRKRAKNHSYTTLLNNAPMLPSSPDLEDRPLVSTTFQTPIFSPQVLSTGPPLLYLARAPPLPEEEEDAPPTTALPSLDDSVPLMSPGGTTVLRNNKQWLRMKRRQSLVCALRLAATTS